MKDCPGVRHNLTTLAWEPNLFFPLLREGHLSLTASLCFGERQSYVGSQTNRILPIAIVFLKQSGPSEMLCEVKPPPSIGILGDVAKWLILVLPEDHFSLLGTVTIKTNFK